MRVNSGRWIILPFVIMLLCILCACSDLREETTDISEDSAKLSLDIPGNCDMHYTTEAVYEKSSSNLVGVVPSNNGFTVYSEKSYIDLNLDWSVEAEHVYRNNQFVSAVAMQQDFYAFYRDGLRCGIMSIDNSLFEFDADSMELISVLPVENGVYTLSLHPEHLYFNDDEIKLPDDNYYQYSMAGFWKLLDNSFIVIKKYHCGSTMDDFVIDEVCLYPLRGSSLGEPTLLEDFYGDIQNCSTDGKYNYFTLNEKLYRMNEDSVECLGGLLSLGVNPDTLRQVLTAEDGNILVVDEGALTLLKPSIGLAQSQILRIGLYPDTIPDFTDFALQYSREVNALGLEIKSFSNLSDVNLAILSGEIDVLALQSSSVAQGFSTRDILLPLDEWMSESLTTDCIFSNIVSACRSGESIYYFPTCFSLVGMCLPSQVLTTCGNQFESYEMLRNCLDSLDGESYPLQTKRAALDSFLRLGLDNWVDFEAGIASFENDDFTWILEFCMQGYTDYDEWAANAGGRESSILKTAVTLRSPYAVEDLAHAYENRNTGLSSTPYGTAGTVFPGPSAINTGLAIDSPFVLCIPASSPQKETAVLFLNWIISVDTQRWWLEGHEGNYYNGFSVNPKLTYDSITQCYSIYSEDELDSLVSQCMGYIQGADHFSSGYGSPIEIIIHEEAEAYFAGECSAQECESRIQNRVSIYLAEQN